MNMSSRMEQLHYYTSPRGNGFSNDAAIYEMRRYTCDVSPHAGPPCNAASWKFQTAPYFCLFFSFCTRGDGYGLPMHNLSLWLNGLDTWQPQKCQRFNPICGHLFFFFFFFWKKGQKQRERQRERERERENKRERGHFTSIFIKYYK